jgi:3-hydroxyacyl-[acyl-carrier-protein] dehydratase
MTTPSITLDFLDIQKIQKNRFPFLMVDKVTSLYPGKSALGYKNLSGNEWFFQCHWEGDPNMPGMLQIEALMQLSSMVILSLDGNKGKVMYVIKMHEAVFRKKVLPGDSLQLSSEVIESKRGITRFSAAASVDGEFVCSANFSLVLPDAISKNIPKKNDSEKR